MIDESFDEYRKRDALNFSKLKHAHRSPAHFQYAITHDDEDTVGRMKGRLLHAALFEPDTLLRDYVTWDGDRRGRAWSAFCEQHPDKTIVRLEEYEAAIAQRDAVRRHPRAGEILAAGKAEQTITWTDERTGLGCKGRIDFISSAVPSVVDLKGTTSVDSRLFGATAAKNLYVAQLAFYCRGLRANGQDLPARILAVEIAPPHDTAVFSLSEDDLWAGEVIVDDLLSKVAAGRFSGQWPGRFPEERPLELPRWAFPDGGEDDLAALTFADTEAA